MKTNESEAVREFVTRVRQLLGSRLVGVKLFGSKARGDDTPESDIDILVEVETASVASEDAVLDIAFDVNLDQAVYISPRVIARAVFNDPVWSTTPFIRALEHEGIPL